MACDEDVLCECGAASGCQGSLEPKRLRPGNGTDAHIEFISIMSLLHHVLDLLE